MQARTWILVAVLAGTAVAMRHRSRADEVAPEVVAPQRAAVVHVAPSALRAAPAPPSVAPPEVGPLAAALTLAGVLEEGPSAESTGEARAEVGGKVRDVASGEAVAGVVVIATSPALEHTQTAITDENGDYRIPELPPGEYLVTFYYADITIERAGLVLDAGWSMHLPLVLDPDERPRRNDDTYVLDIPVPGRVFESALGAAAGSQEDGMGVSFTGVTSLDNTYIVDGESL